MGKRIRFTFKKKYNYQPNDLYLDLYEDPSDDLQDFSPGNGQDSYDDPNFHGNKNDAIRMSSGNKRVLRQGQEDQIIFNEPEEEGQRDQGLRNLENRGEEERGHKQTRVNLAQFEEHDMRRYVREQCEIMEKLGDSIDALKVDYDDIALHFNDIELIEGAPADVREEIRQSAEQIDTLTVDRHILKSTSQKLSNSAYHRMETYENEIADNLKFMTEEESYYEAIKHDMHLMMGERESLRMDARKLKKRQVLMHNMAAAVAVVLFAVYAVLLGISIQLNNTKMVNAYIFITLIAGAFAVSIIAVILKTRRDVAITEAKLNKVLVMMNSARIKYINTANYLDYVYKKYRVKNSYELVKKYGLYQEMKEEQARAMRMTHSLSKAENALLHELDRLGIVDTSIWLSKIKALYNNNDMMDVRHDLVVRRKEIRTRIEDCESKIDDIKMNIRVITKRYPQYMEETMAVLDEFERRNEEKTAL